MEQENGEDEQRVKYTEWDDRDMRELVDANLLFDDTSPERCATTLQFRVRRSRDE